MISIIFLLFGLTLGFSVVIFEDQIVSKFPKIFTHTSDSKKEKINQNKNAQMLSFPMCYRKAV